eukprot:gb/GFBE01079750.1/.p1 GENE.gb/GFBE01079750.1/~~gb/GFBE01079750.1/.p1  ORF type:complete len:104 (+),score=21.74 gb/GFBE01079750.1/:1-312(+)
MSEPARRPVDAALVNSLLTNVLIKASVGSLAFIPGCVAFRGRGMRILCGGLGAGFGAGMAWAQGDMHLRHPDLVPLPKSLPEEMEQLQASLAARARSWTRWFS